MRSSSAATSSSGRSRRRPPSSCARSTPRFVRGNCDREPDEWTRSKLDDETVAWSQGWPMTVELDGVLYCHATPGSDMRRSSPRSRRHERFDEALEGVDHRLVVAGHTHMQFRRGRWVNAGSVGMAVRGRVAASGLVSDDVEFRRTAFDVERAIHEIVASGWPEARVVRGREHPDGAVAARGDRLFESRA